MKNFKVGDEVHCGCEGYVAQYGRPGVITEVLKRLYVVRGADRKCLTYHPHELTLWDTDLAIAAYQDACEAFEAAQACLVDAQLAVEKAKAAVQDARLNLRDALDDEA